MTDQLINRGPDGQPVEDSGDGWLECVPWTGQEKDLPAGYTVKVPGLDPMKFVQKVELLDAEVDEGSRFVKVNELKKGDIIIGAKLNENSIKRVEANYGPDWCRLKSANGGKNFNRYEWREAFGTDGLALLAVRNLRARV